MKRKWIRSDTPLRPSRKVSVVIFFLSISGMLTSCFLKQDRTSVIYGTITDENKQPVDSILVLVDGTKFLTHEQLKQVYSDENGNYELVVEVPRKFGSLDVGVPFFPVENAKYNRNYKGTYVKKNNIATNNCCSASIGQKTKYDFQLIPK